MYYLNINSFFLLDAFESSCIRYYYFFINNIFVFIISTSMIYMFINYFFFFFLKKQLITKKLIYNINFTLVKEIISILYDVVINYISYRHNIFFLLMSYIYIYLFLNNFIGLIPFSNTINNHINITGMISFTCWLGILFIGFYLFSTRLISMFCVSGIPQVLIPLVAMIEIMSYIFRFISLSLRLFANIVAGHILLETIYIFLFKFTLGNNNNNFFSLFLIILPCLFFIILILFEMVVACLQSYIFIILCLIYLKDSLYLH